MLTEHKSEGYQLITRLSHAQYDEVSISVRTQTLLTVYGGKTFSRRGPTSLEFSHTLPMSETDEQSNTRVSFFKAISHLQMPNRSCGLIICQISHSILWAPNVRSICLAFPAR